ncbi:cell death abnormality protein 1-like isoform X1 [Penaeus chinensis]|uniref:cell death abnormality protein 1-like isoform X1 n=1 Tax=Penaeus chinensis TaxID=139456 RepID=UPI001FB77507|nr:cell death abnormality protein 1-like isoform X1 [Penaeus chinensis]
MARLTLIVVVASVMATRATGLAHHEWCLDYKGECVPLDECPASSGQLSCPDGMVCCPFEAALCKRTQDCKELGGKCSYRCKKGEQELPELCGEDCKCCVRERPCSKTAACKAMSGRCDEDCNRNETAFDGLCVGEGCRCCVGASPCNRTQDCTDLGGDCSIGCKEDELEFPELCKGDCKCCVRERPCSKTRACKAISGRCDERCNRHETPYDGLCVGENCRCCVRECKRTDACKEIHGRCDYRCNRNEFPLLGYCAGEGCFCCVRDLDESSVSVIIPSMSSPSIVCPSAINEWPSESSLTTSSESLPASTFTSTHFPSMNSPEHPATEKTTVSTTSATTTSTVSTTTTTSTVSTMSSTTSAVTSTTTSTTTTTPEPCNTTADCEYLKGQCRLSCPQGSLEIPGCLGSCVCCVPDDGQCLNTSSECQDIGGTCVVPGPQLPLQCDAVDLNLCPSESSPCACCVDCTQQTDATCKIQYNGSCKAECNAMELSLGTCQEGCSCCGCETTGECDALGGRCVSAEAHCHGNLAGRCAGESCFCCLPNEVGDKCWWDAPRCLAIAGRCAPSCGAAEGAVEGLCGDGGCACCTSDPEPCLQSSLCGRIGGTCQSECPSYMRGAADLCPGRNCSCCYLP